MTDPPSLSPRQIDCLRLVRRGRQSKEIAIELGITKNTVDGYIAEAVATLGARNRREAAERYFEGRGPLTGSGDDPARVAQRRDQRSPGGPRVAPIDWRSLLPFRTAGADRNALTPFIRLIWIFVLAIGLATGFGMLTVALGVISDLFRGGGHR